nr:ATP-binding protein [Oscillospiraceae bacterium]
MAKKQEYGNESIHSLKGADRIRKRPAVVFGSDGVEGCEHAIFEIISNAIDEARAGYGDRVVITRYNDGSVEVEDFGRGCPVDYNPKEQRYNWELLFCELYAGGKYDAEENYEYSLGLNGLGLCATQYASEWMEAEICRDGYLYHLRFEHGENIGGLQREPTTRRKTGSRIRWKPDREVFTDTDVPEEWYADTVKRQAVVNAGLLFILKNQKPNGSFENTETCYENGIADYVRELIGEGPSLTGVQFWQGERTGRDREDKPDYKVKIQAACCFSNRIKVIEYYHNSSWLEHGGSPEKAVKSAFVSQIDAYIKSAGKYLKNESRISFQDVEDCLVLVISSFSSQTSYENQTKKAINNRFIQQAMTAFFKERLSTYLIENKDAANKIMEQVLINKRSRENAEKTRQSIKTNLQQKTDMANRVQKFIDCRS